MKHTAAKNRFSLLTLVLFTVLLPLSACGGDKSFSDFSLKPFWKSGFKKRFSTTVCGEGQMFTSCFSLDAEECSTAVSGELFDSCVDEVAADLPFFIKLPEEGSTWGRKIGGCIGGKFHDKFKNLAVTSDECAKATEKTLGKKPNMKPLEAFFSDNPSARLLHDALPELKAMFDGIEKAIREQNQSEFSKHYTQLLMLEGRTIAKSSDADIVAYYKNHIDRRKVVEKISPQLCSKVFVIKKALSPEEMQQLKSSEGWKTTRVASKELSAKAVASALESPILDDDRTRIETLMNQAISTLPEETQKKIDNETFTEEDGCAPSIAMMEAFVSLPEQEAGPVLRLLHQMRSGG